jgi:[ribosomal protein S5]-alanine N-acetyltransferase
MNMSAESGAGRLLLTPRLRLAAPDERLAPALVDFRLRNRAHLAPWNPPRHADHETLAGQTEHLQAGRQAFDAGTAYRWLMQPIGDAARVIGSVHFSQISRGPFQSCMLGFELDQALEGQALMTEALRCALGEVFSPHVNLHRVQAAYRPENWRSAEVLKRLGFDEEGLAPDYLYIDGAWRSHRIVALLNKSFVPPAGW